jgi:DnaJ-class molecular chaperone
MQRNKETHYSILGISSDANMNDIKKAYRALSYQYHPDKNQGDKEKEEVYKKINEAYDVLKDSSKRQQYDYEILMTGENMQHIDIEIGDIFGKLFQGLQKSNIPSMRRNMPHPEEFMFMTFPPHAPPPHMSQHLTPPQESSHAPTIEDLHHQFEISLEDSYKGMCAPMVITRQIHNGKKTMEEKETLYVDIPQGVDHNEILVLKEKGNKYGIKQSDVKIHISLQQHRQFQRQGIDLVYNHDLSFKESLLGFSFILPHINGQNIKLNHSKGQIIMNNSEKVIKELGFKRGSACGNLILKFNVIPPENLSESQLKLIDEVF